MAMRPVNLATLAGYTLGGLLAVTACGGDDGATRLATENDLPKMVLQQEDVPAGLDRVPGTELERDPSEDSLASFTRLFFGTLEGSDPEEGLCIGSIAKLYDDAEAAGTGFNDARKYLVQNVDEHEVDAPDLGDDIVAYQYVSDSPAFCGFAESNDTAEYVTLIFRYGNTVHNVTMHNFGGAVSVDEAIDLAEKQAGRSEGALAGDSP